MAFKLINGNKMYYEESGKGLPVLLIHGLGSSTKDWDARHAVTAEKPSEINEIVRVFLENI